MHATTIIILLLQYNIINNTIGTCATCVRRRLIAAEDATTATATGPYSRADRRQCYARRTAVAGYDARARRPLSRVRCRASVTS